jgi:hypothetical protein
MSVYGIANTSNGIVLNMDTKNPKSYRGMPGTNKANTINFIYGNTYGTNFRTWYGTENAYIPALNLTLPTSYCTIWNNDSGANCCPSPFYYSSGSFASLPASPSTLYTYSTILRSTTGYTNANYMYHYEYNGGTYVTEYGLYDTSKRIHLGDNWYHAWNTFTTNASTANMQLGLWHYEYSIFNKISVAAISLVAGNYNMPPEQMLGVGETRTNTNSLIDLTGNHTFDLTNAGYDGAGQLTFNGSSNYIIAPENSNLNTNTPSVEVWIKTNNTNQNGFFFEKGNVNTQYSLFQEGTSIVWRQSLSGGVTSLTATTATYISTSNWAHIVGTYTSGNRRLYINGALVASDATTGTVTTNSNGVSIGVYGGYNGGRGYYYNGQIGMVKVYNRAITHSEVISNYNSGKARYGL